MVGIGVVVLRENKSTKKAEVLLIQRGKSPNKGMWTFPGGGLELGETMEECAAREVLEEAGVAIRTSSGIEKLMGCGVAPQLSACGAKAPFNGTGRFHSMLPTPFTAVDSIHKDDQGRVEFHYMIVEIAASPIDPDSELTPKDDVDDAKWVAVDELRTLSKLVRLTAKVAEEAVSRFSLN
eukprot:CAMPEP_0196592632 /NCGR_PEP_ID=MMETSP1081-20130531/73312_1 /TAXON_ID=36882 /ORGANISM="Pyramimonas amylifera, Strain CCMP720" /LENGTH=179 /DNA_ID=CAMNT_0041916379 /DNA_START=131 /DNA_END=670 /DNA_ORIENTATION=-